jgi:hypothetical protein
MDLDDIKQVLTFWGMSSNFIKSFQLFLEGLEYNLRDIRRFVDIYKKCGLYAAM